MGQACACDVFFCRVGLLAGSVAISVGNDSSDVLMRESKHLWQEVVLVEVFQVVNVICRSQVVCGHLLDLVQDPLVLDKTLPE